MNKLKEIFFPDRKTQIKQITQIISLYKSQIGDCCTCLSYIPFDGPGFVSDYGDCKKSMSLFKDKVLSTKKINCSNYQERSIDYLYKKLKELKEKDCE